MNPTEYESFLKKEYKTFLKNGGCPFCLGCGSISETGMFGRTYICDTYNGKGKIVGLIQEKII